jgi:hypothetical protein
MRKKYLALCLCLVFIVACASTDNEGGKKVNQGFGKAALGLAQLVLSPLQIAAGVLEGIASVPYYLSTSLQDINKGMITANAKVTLDDTYEAAYGKRINAVPESGDTGEVFRRMKHATEYFQKVLSRYGVPNAENYILTSIDTANSKGYTLFAAVYRPAGTIKVIDKYDGTTIRTFSKDDRLYYEPFEKDVAGRKIDTVIDWAGLPMDFIKTQKGQALMLTMAANSVVNEKRTPEYWAIEKRWIAGEYEEIVEQKMNSVKNKMKIDNK